MEYGEIKIKRLPCLTFLGQRPKQAPLCHPSRSAAPLSFPPPCNPLNWGPAHFAVAFLLLLNMIMWHAAKASVNYLLHNFCSPTTMKTNKFLHSTWVHYYFWRATQKVVTKTLPFAPIGINNNSYLQ